MFGRAYFGGRYFGPNYWGDGGTGAPVVPPVVSTPAAPGGIGKGGTKRRKVMLPDGRIITPRDQAEFRRIVADILQDDEPVVTVPKKLKKAKRKASPFVSGIVAKGSIFTPIPAEFWARLETNTQALVNYSTIVNAWQAHQAYQAMQEDEEEVELLLMAS